MWHFFYMCGGLGQRFQSSTPYPKPRMRIFGRPMYAWSLDRVVSGVTAAKADAALHIVLQGEDPEKEDLFREIRDAYLPHFVAIDKTPIPYATRGASETCYLAVQHLLAQGKIRPEDTFWTLDNDVVYDANTRWDHQPETPCMVLLHAWEDAGVEGNRSPYCHVTMNEDTRAVTALWEKQPRAPHVIMGGYRFHVATYVKLFSSYLMQPNAGEWYMSNILQHALNICVSVVGEVVRDSYTVGTPHDIFKVLQTKQMSPQPLRWVFDIDQTLLTLPKIHGDYTTCEPIEPICAFLRQLHTEGHTILLYTARKMKSCQGDARRAEELVGEITRQSLAAFQIPYHELHFGKPFADVYVDDRAVNPYSWVNEDWTIATLGYGWYPPALTQRIARKVVRIDKTTCVKSCSWAELEATLSYHQRAPSAVQAYLPRILSHDTQQGTLTMEWVEGTMVGSMVVFGCLTPEVWDAVLQCMQTFHHSDGGLPVPSKEEMLRQYVPKLRGRFQEYGHLYEKMGLPIERILELAGRALESYEPVPGGCIHGDFWLHNMIWNHIPKRLVTFDMRGRIDGRLHLGGDRMYDYAKLYQSLLGLDHWILRGEAPDPTTTSWCMERLEAMLAQDPEIHARRAMLPILALVLMTGSIPFHPELQACQAAFSEWLLQQWRSL